MYLCRLLWICRTGLRCTAPPWSQRFASPCASSCGPAGSRTPGAPCPGCCSSRWRRTTSATASGTVSGVSVWKHGTHLFLAVRHHHSHSPSPVLGAHVSDRHQRHDLHQTRHRHRRLKHWLDCGLFIYSIVYFFPSINLALEIFPLALLCLIAIPT